MRLPRIRGVIRRRLLVNYRVAPEVIARQLPPPFRPKLHRGHAVAGICLIRLEIVRPRLLPLPLGLASENAAHRIAVEWDDGGDRNEGVFVPRRDSSSWLNHVVGGRLWPGEQRPATFEVTDDGAHVEIRMTSRDGEVAVEVSGDAAAALPPGSMFASLAEASLFFERGSLGYSSTPEGDRYDGLALETDQWKVAPLSVRHVRSTFFEDETRFPPGSVEFDHALIMRDIAHEWVALPHLEVPAGIRLTPASS